MSSLTSVPAVTVMPVAGKWGQADCSRARREIEAKEDDLSGWRTVERNELITGALNTIAGFAVGRTITKIIDPDGTWSSSHTDGTGDTFEAYETFIFLVYSLLCLIVVGCGIYFLFGKVDAARDAHERVSRKIEENKTALEGTMSLGTRHDVRAQELGSRVSHTVRTTVLTRIIDKWSSTQMFTVAVLLHHVYDWTPSSTDAPQNAWDALSWLAVIALVLIVAFYELPVRISARYQMNLNLARLERVVDVGAAALAWLLAVFCMEALEITAAHSTMSDENLKNVHYYSSAYHGLPVTLRTAVCVGTFVVTALALFPLQQIAKRADEKQRLVSCCRNCHSDDDYIREATKRDLENRPRDKLRRDLATRLRFLGQHGHRILETTMRTFTNISSMALQRLIMGLITFADYDVADDFVLKGKSASETAQDFAETVSDIVSSDPVPEPEPEPEALSDGSSSGSWFSEENITETISPLLAACERALSTNNATLLYDSIRSTRQGLSVGGKVVKEVDPEPEPLPEPEPEPEPPPELDEATRVSALKSTKWTDCEGTSHELACSVLPTFAQPEGGPTWVDAQCDDSVSVVCDEDVGGQCDKPGFWNTGAMSKPFCNNMPLYGDSLLLAIFAVLCSVVALWILRSLEWRLRRRLKEAVTRTEAAMSHLERHTNADANPILHPEQGGDGILDTPASSQHAAFLAADDQLTGLQTCYDFMVMWALLVRSLCQWIVNRTWWDVTYNTMKHLDLLSNYYLTSFVLMGIAAIGPLVLYDTSLVKATCCGSGSGRGLRSGLLLRSLSRSESTERSYSSLERDKDDDVRHDEQHRLVPRDSTMPNDGLGRDDRGETLVSIGGILSGPTADESDEEGRRSQEWRELRQDNYRLQEKVAQLEQELAAAGSAGGVVRDLL
eukprot:COSAG02_NODE_5638_length_4164_cov_5.215498_1_plen_901_part_00